MDSKLLAEPNLHSEIYRNITPKLDITILENYLDFIEVSSDGHVIVGSSNLTGRAWFGSVWYYENIDLACKLTTYVANKSFACGVTDGKFLSDSSKMLIVDDSGIIQLMALPDNGDSPDDKLQPQIISEEHEGSITEISLLPSQQQFLSSSTDCSIKLWDLERTRHESNEYFDSVCTYTNCHKETVTSVCTHLTSNDLFASCSSDREALLWDLRLGDKPALSVYENNFCGLTNVKWHPLQENIIAVGAENGTIYLIDLRDPNQFLSKLDCFSRSIYRIKFNNKGWIGVCADTKTFQVVDASDPNCLNIIYENDQHSDMIRGISWINDKLLVTCGWDKKIYKHDLADIRL